MRAAPKTKFSSFNPHPQIDKRFPLNATERQIIQSSLTSYRFGLDSRFGVELVQLVSMWLGQGHSLAASEETDPLTVDECCGGQTARNISRLYSLEKKKCRGRKALQQDAALIYGALFGHWEMTSAVIWSIFLRKG